jgi:hypothetical protein
MDKIGKKSGVRMSSAPKYFFTLSASNSPYLAFAGSVHGGLFPLNTLIPPKNTGWNLEQQNSIALTNYHTTWGREWEWQMFLTVQKKSK